jgi:hypothetical protein
MIECTRVVRTQPVAAPAPVEGLTPGRMVAYFPRAEDFDLLTPGGYPYLAAILVYPWAQSGTSEVPAANLSVQTYDGKTVFKSSVGYSHVPCQGCWSFTPKDGLIDGEVAKVAVMTHEDRPNHHAPLVIDCLKCGGRGVFYYGREVGEKICDGCVGTGRVANPQTIGNKPLSDERGVGLVAKTICDLSNKTTWLSFRDGFIQGWLGNTLTEPLSQLRAFLTGHVMGMDLIGVPAYDACEKLIEVSTILGADLEWHKQFIWGGGRFDPIFEKQDTVQFVNLEGETVLERPLSYPPVDEATGETLKTSNLFIKD